MTAFVTRKSALPDLVIASILFLLCAGAMLLSFTYPLAVSMLLPRIAAGLGLACSAWMIVNSAVQVTRRRREELLVPEPRAADRTVAPESDEETEDQVDTSDPEWIFAHTPKKVWLVALVFIAGFFLVMYFFGLFVAAALFAVTYLRLIGMKSWLFVLIYSAVLTTLLYLMMRVITYIPSPAGVILPGG